MSSDDIQVRKDNPLWDETDEEWEGGDNRSHDSGSEDEKNGSEESECRRESPNKKESNTNTITNKTIKNSNNNKYLNSAKKINY